ncbi:MAG: hypothetical protein ACRC35_03530 [Angustibacter sp.]
MPIAKVFLVATAALIASSLAAGPVSHASYAGDDTAPPLPAAWQRVTLDPADFTTRIDNPFWPMRPGDRRVFRVLDETGATARVVSTVTGRTRVVANGVTARVVSTVVREDGELVERNTAWYAQDEDGNVWYLGERAREITDGVATSTDGSWEAGVDGAQAGVIMPAKPTVGMKYDHENAPGVAEDRGEIFSLDERVEVPAGQFTDVLLVKETEASSRQSWTTSSTHQGSARSSA